MNNSNLSKETTDIVEMANQNKKERRANLVGIIFGIAFFSVILIFIVSIFLNGWSKTFLIILGVIDALILSLINNPLNWLMGGVLVFAIFVFIIFLPKRKIRDRKPMSTARIAEIGVVTAAVAVVYLTTAWIIDAILPYIGCVGRTIAVAVFLSGVRHYKWWELFLITTLSLLITLIIIPCPINTIAIPISMAFVLVYGLLRRHTPPWISITLGTIAAYIVMMASIAFINPDAFWDNFTAALSLSWILLIIIPFIIWWRTRKSEQVDCQGCDKDCDRFSLGKN